MSFKDHDPSAETRKSDHISLAFKSQINQGELDKRFSYEPLLASHPQGKADLETLFLDKKMSAPLWVSSMTGGTKMAYTINHRLAKACKRFGMGMGLGSCRLLLSDDTHLKDFDVRQEIGDALPLFANLGIAQVEYVILQNQTQSIIDLVNKLQADGLIVHINPLQEALQPEGDRFTLSPIDTIQRLLDKTKGAMPIIVKEVGQGMGYQSLKALFALPLTAIDFAASGGTNFAMLELLRSQKTFQEAYKGLAYVGHTALEMVEFTNQIILELGEKRLCKQVIISGGIKNFLDGYFLTQKVNTSSIYGQASAFLKYASTSEEALHTYIRHQIEGLKLAKSFLVVN